MKGGNAECHIDEHAAVLASLEGVRRLLDDPERDRGTRMRIVSGLVAELQRWLPVHVGEMDRALAAHRFRERTGGALLRLAPRT
jgi:hemerythrin